MTLLTRFLQDTPSLGVLDILINITLAGLMAFIIRLTYIKYGTAMSNRRQFSYSFFLITMCTALIIELIQSSIALSLGLVGALSIIRFRTAIKDPQELTFVFLCVTVGLGFGANQRLLTISACCLILLVIVLINLSRNKKHDETYNLLVKSKNISLDDVVELIKEHCKRAELKRFDETPEGLNAVFFAEFKEYSEVSGLKSKLKEMDNDIIINFVSTTSLG